MNSNIQAVFDSSLDLSDASSTRARAQFTYEELIYTFEAFPAILWVYKLGGL